MTLDQIRALVERMKREGSAPHTVEMQTALEGLLAVAEEADRFCSGPLAPEGDARLAQNNLSRMLAALEATP